MAQTFCQTNIVK